MKDKISAQDVADQVYMSLLHFQKGFQVLTGYSVAEYIRNRKLYLAALDLKTDTKVIDVAFDYGYETPESFTKAFTRFHGASPSEVKQGALSKHFFLWVSKLMFLEETKWTLKLKTCLDLR